jgi:hypothetical protein
LQFAFFDPTFSCISGDRNTKKLYINRKQLLLAHYKIEKGCLPAICEGGTKYNAKDNRKFVVK